MKGLSKKGQEFLEQLSLLRDYCLNLNEDKEQTLDVFIHSLLVMFDGNSGLNDFKQIILTTRGHKVPINENDWLHEQFFRVVRKMHGLNESDPL